ncbi:MAG: DNA polymerase I [Sandaracinaceae bacterium]|nr:DNA polymerase I [Sandaracinaceae bacterium]
MAETPTRLPAPADPETLYVVDLTGYVYRAYHALPPMSTSKGEPTHAVFGVTQMLLALVQTQKPAMLAVCLDAPGASAYRKSIYKDYKANRPAPPPDLREQIDRLEEVVAAYAIPSFSDPGLEADDLIATLVAKAKKAGLRVVIVSADKDLLQLVDQDVVLYDTMRDKVYGVPETLEKLGVPPAQVRDYLALVGDSSDNVPGVPSVGPKTASKLLSDFGTLDELLAHLDRVDRKALRKTLEEHAEQAKLSQKLVTLRDDAEIELDKNALRYGGADEDKLRELFGRLEFHRLLAQLQPRPAAPAKVSTITREPALRALAAKAQSEGALALWTVAEGEDALHAPIVGLALGVEGEIAYVPVGHLYAGAPPQLSLDAAAAILAPLLRGGVELVLGDAKRELLLWHRRGIALGKIRFDAMLGSYLVDPERHGHSLEEIAQSELHRELPRTDALVEKARGSRKSLCDVAVEAAQGWAGARADLILHAERMLRPRLEGQGLLFLLNDVELPLARVLAKMEREGILVDAAYLKTLSEAYAKRIAKLEQAAYALAGGEFKIGSPRALETILFDELGLRVIKRTKTARSTDHEVLEELAREHDLPRVIVEHRMLTKLSGTYLDALPRQIDPDDGRVHTRLNQAVAATGRMSSSEPNLQNIPIRTDDGRAIRSAFVAREGWQLLSADYSQIELRVLAHLSEDPELVEAFTKDEDVHVRTAAAVFGVDRSKVTKQMRGDAKTVNYAVIYGQTQFALARNLGIGREDAQRYIDAFFERYAGVARFMEQTVEQARQSGGVRTLLGRWRTLPDIRSRNRGLRMAAERVARNTPIQGTAADLMKVAMVRIDARIMKEKLQSKMLLTVHDELVFEVAPGEEAAMKRLVKHEMEHVMELKVPLVADTGLGRTWNEAH